MHPYHSNKLEEREEVTTEKLLQHAFGVYVENGRWNEKRIYSQRNVLGDAYITS